MHHRNPVFLVLVMAVVVITFAEVYRAFGTGMERAATEPSAALFVGTMFSPGFRTHGVRIDESASYLVGEVSNDTSMPCSRVEIYFRCDDGSNKIDVVVATVKDLQAHSHVHFEIRLIHGQIKSFEQLGIGGYDIIVKRGRR